MLGYEAQRSGLGLLSSRQILGASVGPRAARGRKVARQVALTPDEATVDRVRLAAELLEFIALEDTFVDFLTLPAYNRIVPLP